MKKKIQTLDSLAKIVQSIKLDNKKVILCHGVFDLLHIGHIKHFQEEKKLGDCCTLQRGFDLPRRLRKNGDYPLVSSSGISDTHNEFKVLSPGVATGRSGSIGKVFFIEHNFWPLNTVLYIKDFHNNSFHRIDF